MLGRACRTRRASLRAMTEGRTMRGRWRGIGVAILVAAIAAAAGPSSASALPANPWTGQWRIPKAEIPCNDRPELGIVDDQVFSAVQTGSTVTIIYTLLPSGKGGQIVGTVSADGSVLTAGDAPAGWTENAPAYCFGTGHATIQLRMAADARSFSTIQGRTDLGNVVAISGTYLGGGTEPRGTR
jgi:hypothetical protein